MTTPVQAAIAPDPRLPSVRRLREAYRAVCRGLPWLDMAVWPDDPPAFPRPQPEVPGAGVRAITLEPALRGRLASLRAEEDVRLLRYAPSAGPLEAVLADFAAELAAARLPLVVLHTDVSWDRLDACAARHPALAVIIESGPVKILYHLEAIEALLRRRPNVRLCLANFCNWLGVERLVERGLGERLLFGSHRPRFNPHAAMGPIVMSRLDWPAKCGLAGDNLRRLLGEPVRLMPEVPFAPPPPFIVDAHTHFGGNGRFPVPDERFAPADWLPALDAAALATAWICPMAALRDSSVSARALFHPFREGSAGRFRYFEVFHPRADAGEQIRRLDEAAADPACCGVKIHPTEHQTPADDPAYGPVFAWARERGRPILTHSWDLSATNPAQACSFPSKFRRHLAAYPGVRLVLGHAGGRPGSLAAVAALCREFPAVRVDLAGDYYDSGLVEELAGRLGPERVLFGSDLNWIDPRANLAFVLASELSDEAAALILGGNARALHAEPGVPATPG